MWDIRNATLNNKNSNTQYGCFNQLDHYNMDMRIFKFDIVYLLKKVKYLIKGLINLEYPRKSLRKLVIIPSNFEQINNGEDVVNCFISWTSDKLNRTHYREYLTFILKNPDIKFYLFNDKLQDDWMLKYFSGHAIFDIYKGLKFNASKSDVFRLCLLQIYGGIFVSLNRVIDQPINSIPRIGKDFILSFEKIRYVRDDASHLYPKEFRDYPVQQSIIAAPKNHKILDLAIRYIIREAPNFNKVVFEYSKKAIWQFTGPYSLTHAIDEYINTFGLKDLYIYGFNFNGSTRLAAGAEYRYAFSPSYLGFRNKIILDIKIN